jgi:hypothetical protein
MCRQCRAEYSREWQQANPEKRRETTRKSAIARAGTGAAWRERNKESLQAKARIRYEKNRAAIIERSKQRVLRRRREEPDVLRKEHRETMRARRAAKPEEYRATTRTRDTRKWRTDTAFRLRKLMRNAINNLFRRYLQRGSLQNIRGRHWETLLGYRCEALETRLRSTVPAGYAWEDFLSGKLHIDHIRPIASFDIQDLEGPAFRECWALSNLQLLPEYVNKSKGAKLQF